ncbi:hypothetical protein YC2023_111980 [Brassica napus]
MYTKHTYTDSDLIALKALEKENSEEEAHNSSPKHTNKRRKRGSCESNMIKQSKTLHGESESDQSKRKHYPFATNASKPLYRLDPLFLDRVAKHTFELVVQLSLMVLTS